MPNDLEAERKALAKQRREIEREREALKRERRDLDRDKDKKKKKKRSRHDDDEPRKALRLRSESAPAPRRTSLKTRMREAREKGDAIKELNALGESNATRAELELELQMNERDRLQRETELKQTRAEVVAQTRVDVTEAVRCARVLERVLGRLEAHDTWGFLWLIFVEWLMFVEWICGRARLGGRF